jgi:hypothetical protein
MAAKLTWDDAEKIGMLLSRKHPELYPPTKINPCLLTRSDQNGRQEPILKHLAGAHLTSAWESA